PNCACAPCPLQTTRPNSASAADVLAIPRAKFILTYSFSTVKNRSRGFLYAPHVFERSGNLTPGPSPNAGRGEYFGCVSVRTLVFCSEGLQPVANPASDLKHKLVRSSSFARREQTLARASARRFYFPGRDFQSLTSKMGF